MFWARSGLDGAVDARARFKDVGVSLGLIPGAIPPGLDNALPASLGSDPFICVYLRGDAGVECDKCGNGGGTICGTGAETGAGACAI